MATILFVTSSLTGMLYTGVELARRLAQHGHQLTYASFSDARKIIESQGLDFLPLEPSRYDEFLSAEAKLGALRRLRNLKARRQAGLSSLAVDSLPQTLQHVKPDLILIDGEMHEHILVAAASGIPMALLNTFVSIWRQPGLPPPHHLARPGLGWRGSKFGMRVLWQALRFRKWRTAWLLKIQRVGCDRLSLHCGFDFHRQTDSSQWLIPFTYRYLPVLSLHAQEFEFPHRPPVRVRYLGPMLLRTRRDEPLTDTDRRRLEMIFQRHDRSEKTLIYAGFGSFFSTDLDFVHRLFTAVAKRDNWDLVISLGGRAKPTDLGRLPGNVHAFGWLPQLEVLQHSDVAVTHGGLNTIDECVLSGVPMLIYCGFETDMAGNTSRVVHHGIGLAGDRRRDSQREIREQIDRLLREPDFRNRIQGLRKHYEAYAENRVAERAVDSLLGRSNAKTPS